MQLTPEQKQAIENADRDMAILASAGSGKTFVLTEMVCRLIRDLGVTPQQIIVVTFTEKAAAELKERIASRLEKPKSFLEDCPVGTIHSFIAARLRESATKLPRDFIIWEENRSLLERSRIVHEQLRKLLIKPSGELVNLITEYGWRPLANLLTAHLGMRWKLRALKSNPSEDPLWSAYRDLYDCLHRAYLDHKRRHGAVDFEDLEEEALQLFFETSSIADGYQYIFVDEYQDTSPPQYELIQGLHQPGRNHLVIVGDPLQSIYRFRGAKVALFEKTRQALEQIGAGGVKLTTNFRSSAALIDSLNVIFGSLFCKAYIPMRAANNDQGLPGLQLVVLPKTKTLGERRERESESIVGKIKKMISQGRSAGDFAILFRSRAAMNDYEIMLEEKEIPFWSQRGNQLLEQQEIIDQINVFRALCHPEDEISLVGVLRSPLGGISDEMLWSRGVTILDGPEKTVWDDVAAWWRDLKEESPYLRASEVAHRIFQRGHKKGFYDSGQARANLKQWIAFLEWMEQVDPFELSDLLEVVEGFRDDGARIPEIPLSSEDDCVQLMTVHAAKGLEFPIVIVADLTAAIPSPRSPILVDVDAGIGMRRLDSETVGLRDKMVDTDGYLKVKEYIREQELEESKRLLYVACTRAQECLILPLDRNRKEKSPTWNKWLCEALPE